MKSLNLEPFHQEDYIAFTFDGVESYRLTAPGPVGSHFQQFDFWKKAIMLAIFMVGSHSHQYDFWKKKILWAISKLGSPILQYDFWQKQSCEQYLQCDHIFYNWQYDFWRKKQSYEQYLWCGSTIWFLKNAMSSADILTVWQQHFKTLTTDSNCLPTSKKFCTLPHSLADCLTWLDLMVKIFTGIYK